MKIIPAIDILNGKCVRLTKGDYNTQIIYNENPLEVALELEANGIKYLHVVDLDGAKSKHVVNSKVLEELANKTQLQIDFGGGIKSEADVKLAFDCGAKQITLGSIAVDQPDLVLQWLNQYCADKIILGADCKDRMVATHGWIEQSSLDVVSFISRCADKGFTQVICTDVAKDGMLEGTSVGLYEEILSAAHIQLIASGGVSSIQDIEQLKAIGCAGVIVGKAIYENRISLKELSTLC